MSVAESGAPPRPYWLDAAALVKLVSSEEEDRGSDRVQKLLEMNGSFHTTWICVAVAYGLLKRRYLARSNKKADQDTYARRLYMLRNRIGDGTIQVHMDWLQEEGAFPFNAVEVKDFAKHHEIDFLDALQIFEFRRGISGAGQPEPLLVTTDAKLVRAAEAFAVGVWNPEEGDLAD